MPFGQLVNAQQVQITVAGPGDVNTLYLCKGLAQGNFSIQVSANSFEQASDTWQFEVVPTPSPGQFRQAIVTSALAGVQQSDAGLVRFPGWSRQPSLTSTATPALCGSV